jgi:hypothetical protein
MPGIHRPAVSRPRAPAAARALAVLACRAAALAAAGAAAPAAAAPAPEPGPTTAAPGGDAAPAGNRQIELPAAVLERYAGYYALGDAAIITVSRDGTQLSAQLTGREASEIYPESAAAFVFRNGDAQIDFIPDPPARIDALVLHENGVDHMAQRVDAGQAQRILSAAANRQQGQAGAPGAAAAVRRLLAGIEAGAPDYAAMTPEFADATRAQLPKLQSGLAGLGAVQALQFQGVSAQGWDVYFVQHEHGSSQVRIQLTADGHITGALISTGP